MILEVSVDIDMMIMEINRDIVKLWMMLTGSASTHLENSHYDWLIDYNVNGHVGNYSLDAHTIATAWWHYDHNRYELPCSLDHLSDHEIEKIWKHIKGIM